MRPGNLRGYNGMAPKSIGKITAARKRVIGRRQFGYFGTVPAADDAKNSISAQLLDLESRATVSNVDPQAIYLEATTMQKNLQNYDKWDSGPHTWTSVPFAFCHDRQSTASWPHRDTWSVPGA